MVKVLSAKEIQKQLDELGFMFPVTKKISSLNVNVDEVVIAWGADENAKVTKQLAIALVRLGRPFQKEDFRDLALYLSNKFGSGKNLLFANGLFFDGMNDYESLEEATRGMETRLASSLMADDPEFIDLALRNIYWKMADQHRGNPLSSNAIYELLIKISSQGFSTEFQGKKISLEIGIAKEKWLSLFQEFSKWVYQQAVTPSLLNEALTNLALANNFIPRKVLDPFAGIGSTLNALRKSLPDGVEFTGFEVNPEVYRAAKALDSDGETRFFITNSMSIGWGESDLIITQPPMGLKLPEAVAGMYVTASDLDAAVIDKAVQSLSQGGRAVLCTSRAWTSRSGVHSRLRQALARDESIWIRAIIGLPSLVPGVSVELCLVVLQKSHRGKTLFADLREDWYEQLSPGSPLMMEYEGLL